MEITDAVIIPIILSFIEAAKNMGMTPKLAPVVAVLLGLAGGIFLLYPDDLQNGIVYGIIMGLSASGLYSGVKSTVKSKPTVTPTTTTTTTPIE